MSTVTTWMPSPQKDLSAASRQYVEQFGSYLVTITYLKIAVLALSLLSLALVALNIKTYQAFRYMQPGAASWAGYRNRHVSTWLGRALGIVRAHHQLAKVILSDRGRREK